MTTPTLNPNITVGGLALVPSPDTPGLHIELTHIALGTGKYTPVTNADGAATQTMLQAEVARYKITSGTSPTPTQIQIGTTITDVDETGRSPNGKEIGEIGFFSGNTLFAVWSRPDAPLFVKSASFDVPFAYTLDVSILPPNMVTITVPTDTVGMAALILQHEAKVDPHPGYVRKVRGIGEYDPLTVYDVGARVIGNDGKTYRSMVAANQGNTPSTNPTKWERWGHTLSELDAEFVPKRTALQVGAATALGMVRVQNPDAAYFAAAGAVTGAFKITLPTAAYDDMLRMRVELYDASAGKSFTLIIGGYVTAGMAWSNQTVSILSQRADRDFTVRFGNDGSKPCVWIGEIASTWTDPRVHVAEVMVSGNADGGTMARWATGWALGVVTAFSAVAYTSNSNLLFAQTDIAHVAGLQGQLDLKAQAASPSFTGTANYSGGPGWTTNGWGKAIRLATLQAIQFSNSNFSFGVGNSGGTLYHFVTTAEDTSAPPTYYMTVSSGGIVNFTNRPVVAGQVPWDTGNLPQPMVRNGYNQLNGAVQLAWDSAGIPGGYALGLIYNMGANQKGGIGALGNAQDANNWQSLYLATGAAPYDQSSSPSGIWADYSGTLRTKGTLAHTGNGSVSGGFTVSGTLQYGVYATQSGAINTQVIKSFWTNGVPKIALGLDGTTEAGANAGANFAFWRYSDAGAYIDQPLTIDRATGNVTVANGLTVGAPAYAPLTLQSANPTLIWKEVDQTLPGGLWRMVADGGGFTLRKNTAAAGNFSTEISPIAVDANSLVSFASRPSWGGMTPWDNGNLNPANYLGVIGGTLSPNGAIRTQTGFGQDAFRVLPGTSSDIGGAFVDWTGGRTPALQIDCPSNTSAYMGIKWTNWATRHLAAIDCYAGGTASTAPTIVFHLSGQTSAWNFSASDITRGAGGYVWGSWNLDPNTKASAGAPCQWNTGITEFGAVSTGESAGTADLPAPYVLVGLRNTFYMHYLRAVQLRNQ